MLSNKDGQFLSDFFVPLPRFAGLERQLTEKFSQTRAMSVKTSFLQLRTELKPKSVASLTAGPTASVVIL